MEMNSFNTKTFAFTSKGNMNFPHDLRNKAVLFNGEIYTIGGNEMKAEKYNIKNNTWIPIPSYFDSSAS